MSLNVLYIKLLQNNQNHIFRLISYHIFAFVFLLCVFFELINVYLVNENDIVVGCKNVPTIWYTTDDGIKHRHYVDIFIPTQNRCIEVKGEWFYRRDKNILKLKKQEAENLGYKYEIWVYNKKGEKIKCYE